MVAGIDPVDLESGFHTSRLEILPSKRKFHPMESIRQRRAHRLRVCPSGPRFACETLAGID
jgi:hypothetical protein